MATELEEGGEVHGREQLPQDGRLVSANNTQERRRLNSPMETTVELAPLPREEAKIETDGQKSEEEEVKEGKDEFCEETEAQVEIEKLDMDDKNELEKETAHSKETDSPRN